jgi:hypothetical protein
MAIPIAVTTAAITDWGGISGAALIGPAIGLVTVIVAVAVAGWMLWDSVRQKDEI